jgi:uncharacterized membrane protein YhaH (DUF805 family)
MLTVRRLLSARVGTNTSAASVIQAVMTTVGVVTFLAGVLYLPTLAPTRVEMFLLLLGLAAVALLCTAVGQLAVVIERLEARGKSPPA